MMLGKCEGAAGEEWGLRLESHPHAPPYQRIRPSERPAHVKTGSAKIPVSTIGTVSAKRNPLRRKLGITGSPCDFRKSPIRWKARRATARLESTIDKIA